MVMIKLDLVSNTFKLVLYHQNKITPHFCVYISVHIYCVYFCPHLSSECGW